MKTLKKSVCSLLCLLLLFSFSSRPTSAASNYSGIELNNTDWYDRSVSLQIGDLVFQGGKLTRGVNAQALDTLIAETLEEIGITAEDVEKGQEWTKYGNEKMAEFEKILEGYDEDSQIINILTNMPGLLPKIPGSVAGFGSAVFTGVTDSGVSGVINFYLGVAGVAAGLATGGTAAVVIGGVTWLLQNTVTGIEDHMIMSEGLENIKEHLPDINNAMNFSKLLQEKIEDSIEKNGRSVQIIFDNCVAQYEFSFYNTAGNKSIWVVNLNLSETGSSSNPNGTKKLEGDFSISVKSNFEAFAANPIPVVNNLPMIEGKIQKIIDQEGFKSGNVTAHSVVEPLGINQNPLMERTITGKAAATFVDTGSTLSLYFMQESDDRTVNFAATPAFQYTVWTEAPNVGKTMEKSAQFQFQCAYSGTGNPSGIDLVGFGPQVWFNPIFYPATDPWYARERANVTADVKKQFDEYVRTYPWDKSVWAPWNEANPPAALTFTN